MSSFIHMFLLYYLLSINYFILPGARSSSALSLSASQQGSCHVSKGNLVMRRESRNLDLNCGPRFGTTALGCANFSFRKPRLGTLWRYCSQRLLNDLAWTASLRQIGSCRRPCCRTLNLRSHWCLFLGTTFLQEGCLQYLALRSGDSTCILYGWNSRQTRSGPS